MELPPHRPPRGEPMRCPACQSRLVELERNDVLIDACPECRGVWLDRGELDRLLAKERQGLIGDPDEDFYREMSGAPRAGGAAGPSAGSSSDGGRRKEPDLDDIARLAKEGLKAYKSSKGSSYKGKKKKSVLGELFDF